MTFYKHDPIEGRPLFTNQAVKPDKPDQSILKDNRLLKKLKPVKNPSQVAAFFRRVLAQVSQYFGVKHPDPIKEELKNIIRPIDSSQLTVGNLWHHYEHFLREDKDCPPALKKCFDRMEQDEKEIHKLTSPLTSKNKQDKEKDSFIKKTTKSIEKMKVGSSRLFLLNRQMSTDQSLSGDLFCTITRTKDGYNLSFTGSGENMDALQKGFPLAGKDKSSRILSFDTIAPNDFTPFLNGFISDWINPAGISPERIITQTKSFTTKASSSLEDFTTKSSRPDKLFWNIVLSIPQDDQTATTPASVRSIRLRAELLTLYEAYDEARIDLDPKSRQFKDLTKLLETVSGKVLLHYRKGYLSDKDFEKISERLKIMDDTLRKAKQEYTPTISSSISGEKHTFPNVSLKKAKIKPPKTASNQPAVSGNASQTIVNEKLVIPNANPIRLATYSEIKTKDAFFDNLTRIHSLCNSMANMSSEEQVFAMNDLFRFFHELPFNDLGPKDAKNLNSLWWNITKDEAQTTLENLVEITELISKMKQSSTITQYEYASIVKLRNISVFVNAIRSGFYFNDFLKDKKAFYGDGRVYDRVDNRADNYVLGYDSHFRPTRFLQPLAKSMASMSSELKEAQNLYYSEEDYKLIYKQEKIVIKLMDLKQDTILGIEAFSFTRNNHNSKETFKHWIRPIRNAFLSGLYKNALTEGFSTPHPPEAFFDDPEGTFRSIIDVEAESQTQAHLPGIQKDLQVLSRLLRKHSPHIEFLAFIKEHSKLLYNQDIRNLFDALFFHHSVQTTISNEEASLYPQVIGAEIAKLENSIDDQDQFELLLYYTEMLIRIKKEFLVQNIPTDEFPDLEARMEELCGQCKTTNELNPLLGYASRLLLRVQLENGQVDPGKLGNVLNTYADIHTSSISKDNIEPDFENEMKLHWQPIYEQLKTIDPASLIPLVKRLSLHNGAPQDDSDWTFTNDLVFQNDQVEVDLKLWTVKLKQAPTEFVKFPLQILQDPFMKAALRANELNSMNVLKEVINGTTVYSFKDKAGTPIQVQDKNGNYAFYKEFDINGTKTWLQGLDLTPETKEAKYKDLGLFSAHSLYKEIMSQIALSNAGISLFSNQLFMDPDDKKIGYVVDATGKITFKVKLKQDSKNVMIDKIWDHRELPHSGPWELYNASLLENKSLNFLKSFENKNNILLWAKKGKLKRVELVRYGLKFDLVDGKLQCQSGNLKGYFLKTNSDLDHGLVLEHPTKGRKLLLADIDAVRTVSKTLESKAKGFGKISLALHQLDVAANLVRGILPKAIGRDVARFDPAKDKLKFTTFDLRAITGEICVTGSTPPRDLLQLIKHQIASGHFNINDFPIKAATTDTKLLGELIKFCASESTTGAEAAIKLKFAKSLLKALSDNKRLKENIKQRLEQIIAENGKAVMRFGRKIPRDLQLTDLERENIATIPVQSEKPLVIEERIQILENKLKPSERLADDQLSVTIEKLAQPESILFTSDKVQKYFTTSKVDLPKINLERTSLEKPYEKAALDEFQASLDDYQANESARDKHTLNRGSRRLQKWIDDKLLPKQVKLEEDMDKLKRQIEKSVRNETTAEGKVALIAKYKRAPTFDELRDALIQGTLNDPALEGQLIEYFDALARRNAIASAITLLEKMKSLPKQDTKNWDLMSRDLHRLLTLERKYDPKKHPELLVFEAQLALNLRELDGGLNQLDLLEALLADPHTLVQAPTGAGKTSVFSVLESLLKATGNNLVVQKVLPPLYNQTLDKVEDVIGDLFQTKVMPLRFNLKMRLTTNEYYNENNEEKTKQVSIFKGMYEDLLEVMANKGCVLTDYTSFPMLEAKFLQIGQELTMREPTEVELEHYTYLRKILILHRNKGLESMDEFDQPNRPIQKIQLDLQMGATDIPPFYIDTAFEIYEILGNNPLLGLDKNIQGDISETVKDQALKDAAKEMARRLANQAGRPGLAQGIENYLLGMSEPDLEGIDPALKDKIAFSMKQFTIFLPLCLNGKEGSRYARSADGSKTLPCQSGQKHDAKQGTLYEQLNYTIQDYRQKGITEYDLRAWHAAFDPDLDQAEFAMLFPGYTVDQVRDMIKTGISTLVQEVNQNKSKVLHFLRERVQLLKSSGYLISMDPTTVGDMSRAISGISATSGAKESLHHQFKQDEKTVGQIKASMAYRIQNRALNPDKVLAYDPEHPEQALPLLEKPATVIIDGSGAFNDSTKNAADELLASNNVLKQVGYHQDETITYNGQASGNLVETGFLFNEAHTRGTDIVLARDAHAMLTVNQKEGFRGLAQKEGRLRGEGQTYEPAMPQGQEAQNLIGLMTKTVCVDAFQDAKDIYRHCTQEIRANLRSQMRERLLSFDNYKDFVKLYSQENCNSLFITKPEKSYSKPGDYFADNHKIQREDVKPEDALKDLYNRNKKLANELNIGLVERDYSDLIDKMPTFVSAMSTELECECEVEAEAEIEAEIEVEVELEQQQEVEMEEDHSPVQGRTYYRHNAFSSEPISHFIHQAYYDARIEVTFNFLTPYNIILKRPSEEPFQRSMYNVGEVYVDIAPQGISKIRIEDPIADRDTFARTKGFVYDIRLGKVVRVNVMTSSVDIADQTIQTPEFHHLIAQIKFFDGRTSGYSPEELGQLRNWLIQSDPATMKKHLLDDVLRNRYRDRSRFEDSQLGALFRELL